MAAFTYIANLRAPLVQDSPVHVAGTQYSIDIILANYNTGLEQPKTQHVSLSGGVETVLKRINKIFSIKIRWPDSENEAVEEFLYSIAGGEPFLFDPFGTVAASDAPINVVDVTGNLTIVPLQLKQQPQRTVTLNLRPVM